MVREANRPSTRCLAIQLVAGNLMQREAFVETRF